MFCSLCAGIAGILEVGWLGTITTGLGQGMELTVIAATVIGGANLTGGAGTAFGTTREYTDGITQLSVVNVQEVATMKRLLLMLCACIPVLAFAQTGEVPKAVMEDLASDLSQIQQTLQEAQEKQEMYQAYYKPGMFWLASDFGKIGKQVKVTANDAPIRAGASQKARTVANTSVGKMYNVLDKTGDWYAVRLDKPVGGFDAGWIKASDTVPVVPHMEPPSSSTQPRDIYDAVLDKVNKLKQKYNENPYLTVTGFTVNVGSPPSIGVNFEFKKK